MRANLKSKKEFTKEDLEYLLSIIRTIQAELLSLEEDAVKVKREMKRIEDLENKIKWKMRFT